MARLKRLKSSLAGLPSRIARRTDAHGHSSVTEPWRNWFSLAKWKRLRWRVLVRDRFTCQWPSCGLVESNASRLVADHKTPHRGDPALFWDEDNLHTLCKPCHDALKQREERAAPWQTRGRGVSKV